VVWIEGEPGIGKSSLVAEALATVGDLGWDIGWGTAGQLRERLPLRVMLDCLQVRRSSPDPRRAHAAELLLSRRQGLFADGDASDTDVEVLLTLVDELCSTASTVMVIDDLQWADNESLIVWDQLAASADQLPLLLIATCQLRPRRPEVQQLRAAVTRRGGERITLEPMAEADVAALVTAIVGSPPGDALRQLTTQASGNPLYLRELVEALIREQALEIGSAAEVSVTEEQIPASLAAVLSDRLSFVSANTTEMLRTAVLFGGTFAVTDLAVLLHKQASKLAAGLQEAVAAGILVSSGSELAFRHPLIQQALYESLPAALRTALHAEAARELAAAGARPTIIAQQLSAAGQPGEGWARDWLIENASTLAIRAPQVGAELLQRELDETPVGDELRDGLVTGLVWVLLAAGSYEEAARQAGQALTVMTDPARRAEAYWVLTRAQLGTGNSDEASSTIRKALEEADLPRNWQARMLALLAMLQRAIAGDLDASGATAQEALTAGQEASDTFATAHALTDLWVIRSVRRDHAVALDYVDRALRTLGAGPRVCPAKQAPRPPDSGHRRGAAVLAGPVGRRPGRAGFVRYRYPRAEVFRSGRARTWAAVPWRDRTRRRTPRSAHEGRPAAAHGPGSARPDSFRPGEPGLPRGRACARVGAEWRETPGHAGASRDIAAARRRDDPDSPVAARPGSARDGRRRQADRADCDAGLRGRGRSGNPARESGRRELAVPGAPGLRPGPAARSCRALPAGRPGGATAYCTRGSGGGFGRAWRGG